VLELSGLQMLITGDGPETASSAAETGEELNSAKAQHRIYALGHGGLRVEAIGDPGAWQTGWSSGESRPRRFGRETLAIGIGALGAGVADAAARCGEFLAVGGVATFQPSDGSNRPDFVVSEASLIPEGHLFLGLSASGGFSWLDRFEANPEARTVGMSELAETALQRSGASAVAIAVIAETAGLVGAALRQAPGQGADWLQFPEIRERLSFTSERAFRDSTTLIGGVIAKSGTALDPWLRPMGRSQALLGHLHGAAFTYRPLRKGRIELGLSVQQLFDGPPVQAVLHLLADPRGFHGAGESEFQRGAIWIAPLLF
jgi:hypothetical protein